MTQEAATPWDDPGASAVDEVDGDTEVAVEGLVDSYAANGTEFLLVYRSMDRRGNIGVLTRRVVVVDTRPPTVRLLGNSSVLHDILNMKEYQDAGAVARDDRDGPVNVTLRIRTLSLPLTSLDAFVRLRCSFLNTSINCPLSRNSSSTNLTSCGPQVRCNMTTLQCTFAPAGQAARTAVCTEDAPLTLAQCRPPSYCTLDTSQQSLCRQFVHSRSSVIRSRADTSYIFYAIACEAAAPVPSHAEIRAGFKNVSLELALREEFNPGLGLYLVYTATDLAGNIAIPAVRRLLPTDFAPPVLSWPSTANSSSSSSSSSSSVVSVPFGVPAPPAVLAVTDAVDGNLQGVPPLASRASTRCDLPGQYRVTYSLEDSAGNMGSAVRTVTVRDRLFPNATHRVVLYFPAGTYVNYCEQQV